MKEYFKNPFVEISYNKRARLGKAIWQKQLRGAELREALLLCMEVVDRYSLTKWLADDRLMGPIEPDDLKWTLEVYIPRLASSSLLRMARLPSLSEENREAVEVMIDKGKAYDAILVLRDFKSEQEAMDWLMEEQL